VTALTEIKGPVILDIPSDPASLFLVRCLVERLSQRLGFPEKEVERMVLAVDEASTNVIRHAYGGRTDERILLTFMVGGDRLEIHVRDFGAPADPDSFQPRELEDLRPGGLGMHFIKSGMDEVDYRNHPEGGMLLRLVKFRVEKETVDR
jgi:anti-sigma regulatory factor (Ser/Thr protein kinase)